MKVPVVCKTRGFVLFVILLFAFVFGMYIECVTDTMSITARGVANFGGKVVRVFSDEEAPVKQHIEVDNTKRRYVYRTVRVVELDEHTIERIFNRFVTEAYSKYVGSDPYHCGRVSEAYVDQLFKVPHPEVVFYNMAIGKKESRFSMAARPPANLKSSAVGIGQIIWKYHAKDLIKNHVWRDGRPITLEMMATDVESNIDAQYIVMMKYLVGNQWHYKKAVTGYFGTSHSDSAINKYWSDVNSNYLLLTQRLLRDMFNECTVHEKRIKVYLDEGDKIPDDVVIEEEVVSLDELEMSSKKLDGEVKKNYF